MDQQSGCKTYHASHAPHCNYYLSSRVIHSWWWSVGDIKNRVVSEQNSCHSSPSYGQHERTNCFSLVTLGCVSLLLNIIKVMHVKFNAYCLNEIVQCTLACVCAEF